MNYEHTVKIQMMIIYTFYWKFVGLDFGFIFPSFQNFKATNKSQMKL